MTTIIKEWLDAERKRKAIEKDLDQQKTVVASLEEECLEYMGTEGIQSVKMDGATIYLRIDRYASLTEGGAALDSLRIAGAGDLIKETINSQVLSSWAREQLDSFGELPACVEGHVQVTEKHRVRMRKA